MAGNLKVTSNKPYLLRAIHEWILDNGFPVSDVDYILQQQEKLNYS